MYIVGSAMFVTTLFMYILLYVTDVRVLRDISYDLKTVITRQVDCIVLPPCVL